MMDKNNKDVLLKVIGAAVAVFLLVYIGIYQLEMEINLETLAKMMRLNRLSPL